MRNLPPDTVWLERTEREEWLTLFREVFTSEMSEKYLMWKYRDAEKLGIGLRQDGKLVAFYGGMPRKIFYEGEQISAVQMGDVMVHPSKRGAFTRKGAFWKIASGYIGSMVGEGNPYALAFGFPNRRAYLLGNRLDLYDAVDRLDELSWSITKPPSISTWQGREYKESDTSQVERLWNEMANSLQQSIVGVRDKEWLEQRYFNHPNLPYKAIIVHRVWSPQKAEGILIVRDHRDNGLEWVDMIGNVAHIPAFWNVLRRYARKLSSKRIFCWITHSHSHYFASTKPDVHDIDIIIPFNILTQGIKPESVRERWWLMAGDTDFR